MRATLEALFARVSRKRARDDEDEDAARAAAARARGGGGDDAAQSSMTTTTATSQGGSASSAFTWRGATRSASGTSADEEDARYGSRRRVHAAWRAYAATGGAVKASEDYAANEDELVASYVIDAFEAPRRMTEVAFQSNAPSTSALGGVFGDTCRGLRCTEDIEPGTTVMELVGHAQLITAQQCARDKSLAELLKYWILVQTSTRVQSLVHRDQLRQWQRSGVLGDYAPWARASDLVGSGFVANPTVEPMHVPLDEMVLSCYLVLERRKGKKSKWYDYISALPSLEDFRRDIPLLIPLREFVQFFGYIECERAHTGKLLSDCDLRWMISQRRHTERVTELTFRHIVSKVAFRSENSANPFTFERTHMTREEFLWGYGVVTTRAFQSPNKVSGDPWKDMLRRMDFVGTFLAPYLDFANHKRPREVEYIITEGLNGNGKVVVRALKHFNAGDYMHISYGAKSNLDLFMRYGFAVADNTEPDGSSNDMFRVDLDDLSRMVRRVPTDVPVRGTEILVRFAQTTEYTYTALGKMLDVTRAHFMENEPVLKAALLEAERDEIVRDDAIWNRDEDVYGNDEDLGDMLWGDDENDDDDDDDDENDDDKNNNGVLAGSSTPLDSPEIVALKRAVEIKALHALKEYMLVEHGELKPFNDKRNALFASFCIWRHSRQRTFDLYAMAAYIAADDLAGGDERSRARRRHDLPRDVKAMLARRADDVVWHDAAKTLARAHVERFRLAAL